MENKIPFFKKLIISIKDLDKYSLLISEKLRRSVIYFLELMIIFTLILSAVITYKTFKVINNACDYITNNMSNFTINSEGLKIESEEPIILKNENDIDFEIILDDKAEEKTSYDEELADYDGIAIVALKNKVVLISNGTETTETYVDLMSKAGIEEINKETLLSVFEDNSTLLAVNLYISIFGVTYFLYAISTALDILALSLLTIIISRIAKMPLKYTQCLTISISAITLPIILNLAYTCANILGNFYIPYFQVMYTLVSYVYIVFAIIIMKSDLIKKKQLIKATIDVKKLEKEQETRDNKEDKEENKENKDNKEEKENKETKKEENKENKNNKEDKKEKKKDTEKEKDNTLDNVKKRVKNKLKDDKENPEPQANIEGGKG